MDFKHQGLTAKFRVPTPFRRPGILDHICSHIYEKLGVSLSHLNIYGIHTESREISRLNLNPKGVILLYFEYAWQTYTKVNAEKP